MSHLLTAAVLQNNINTRPFSGALGGAGSCRHVLSLQSWCRSSPGGANALRAAGAPGTGVRVLFPPAACSWGHTLLGCGRPQLPSPSLLCSSGWALQDGAMLGRAMPCPSPPPSAPSSPALACRGAVWRAHSVTSFFKMQGQFLARLLSRYG